MVSILEKSELKFVGKDETGNIMEILELTDHPLYVGAQFHPEFKSCPGRPSPLFLAYHVRRRIPCLDSYLDKNEKRLQCG
ncbi:hypothetical protein ACS0TY_030932 [Phlomoides rotata]